MNRQAINQRTIKKSISFVGPGLHSGVNTRITLKPCHDATGIFFKRKDVPEQESLIAARWHKVTNTKLSTGLSNKYGHSISTVEHLLAAIRLCHIDNLEIEVDGPEIPIMDGSAKPFVDALLAVGSTPINEPRKAIWIHKTIEVSSGDSYALLLPDTKSKVTVSIDFKEKAIGSQIHTIDVDDISLIQEIVPARTFGFMNQIEELRRQGLVLGGSLNNAILVDDEQVINPEGLRFENEFVRHKILDAIGDLSLIGAPIIGHYHSFKGGHHLNRLLLNKLLNDKSAWSYITLDEFYDIHDREPLYNASEHHIEKTIEKRPLQI